jgi:hypothetical protein
MRYFLLAVTFILASSSFEPVLNFGKPHLTEDHSNDPGAEMSSESIHAGVIPFEFNIAETVTDSTKPVEQMSVTEKMNAHIIHFTGAVMSDTFVLTHFSRAFVNDQYSDFLKPGKYPDGNASLPKSIASSLDGIAIPKKTRLVVYNQPHLKGTILIDITGPAIVNNSQFETSDFYAVANKKNYSRGLQEIFPQKVRRWTDSGNLSMSYWQSFSFEISVVD